MTDDAEIPVPAESEFKVSFDKTGVTCVRPDGTSEAVDWSELEAVTIEATQADAPNPRFIWILWGEERLTGVVFPGGATGSDAILEEMKTKLENFDHKALVTALNCDEHQTFVVWEMADAGHDQGPPKGNDEPNPFLMN